MKQAYPAFISQHQEVFLVYVPDMEIYTEGNSITDAINMARDAIGLKGIDYEDDKKDLPTPSSMEQAFKTAKKNSEIYDYSQGILTLVDVDFSEYRKRVDHKAVKKNCTIPYWLNAEAEKNSINFSKVLQDALMSALGYTNEKQR